MSQQQKQTMIFGSASIFAVSCHASTSPSCCCMDAGVDRREVALVLEARFYCSCLLN